MYANEDIYSGPNDPTANINPKIIGAFYINTKTAKLFVCTDNTFNKNVWSICNPDIKLPKIPEMPFNSKYKAFENKYKPYITYTNTTGYPMYISYNGFAWGAENDVNSGSYIKDVTNNILLSSYAGGTYGDIVCAIIIPGIQFMCGRWDGISYNNIHSLELVP